jgi:TonB family protein
MSKRKFPLLVAIVFCSQLVFCLSCQAALDAFIPPKFKGIILYAPVPNYPEAARSHLTLGAQGVYRLTINPNGTVDEVGILKKAGHYKLDSAMILEFFKWKFKPGSIKRLDVPVLFERDVRVELKNAGSS